MERHRANVTNLLCDADDYHQDDDGDKESEEHLHEWKMRGREKFSA